MTAFEAIEVLKTDMGCYECTFGCNTPYECKNNDCPFRKAIHLAVERLQIDLLPRMIKAEQTEPQIFICPIQDDYEALIEDDPQTEVETMSCAECKHRPIGAEICEEACHYEPQTDWHYDEQDATWYPYKHEDEPQQKSCATCKHALGNWNGESNNCGRCCGADRRFYEPKDEPQTERSACDTCQWYNSGIPCGVEPSVCKREVEDE